jgi:hypothetical protein
MSGGDGDLAGLILKTTAALRRPDESTRETRWRGVAVNMTATPSTTTEQLRKVACDPREQECGARRPRGA